MLSKCNSKASQLHQLSCISIRKVHWYHNFKMAGAARDEYELYNRKPEFGQGEIGDKDRYPHLYWNLHKGRNTIQRVAHQWSFSKDIKPEKIRRDLEKYAYFQKLDALHFLELERHHYSYLEDDAKGAIGYISEDEDDEVTEHAEYGQAYVNASPEYRALVLDDMCDGRPSYEWQVPSRLDHALGYKDVSTAVDILGRESSLENLQMNWKIEGSATPEKSGVILRNLNTMSELCLVSQSRAADVIKTWNPSTVVLQCSADTLLTNMRRTLSASNRTDVMGCCISLSWSVLFFFSDLFPQQPILASLLFATMVTMNSAFFYRTFIDKNSAELKKLFQLCRTTQCDVILSDWLDVDYNERLNQVSGFDQLSESILNPTSNPINELVATHAGEVGGAEEEPRYTQRVMQTFGEILSRYRVAQPAKLKGGALLSSPEWMNTFRDAVNSRRIDLIAHVLNNAEGEKILMCTNEIDNISTDLVSQLLIERLNGNVEIRKSPLAFDGYYERVQVQF